MEYPKTENLYARDPETHHVGPENGFRQEAVGQIARWAVTEKVDGMNMRVIWERDVETWDRELRFAGRTDRAQIPGDLLEHMRQTFTTPAMYAAFGDEDGIAPDRVILFGEGFGPGIQKGGSYGDSKRFILFDVVVDGHWMSLASVREVARVLNVPTVPVLCEACELEEAKALVRTSELLPAGDPLIEGIVGRTDPYLFDSRGRRVAFKYKVRDLPKGGSQ